MQLLSIIKEYQAKGAQIFTTKESYDILACYYVSNPLKIATVF